MSNAELTESAAASKEAMAYQGFNPVDMTADLMQKNVEYTSRNVRVSIPLEGHANIDLTADMYFRQDMRFLVLLFIQRGASWEKIREKSDPEIARFMDVMVSKYAISTRKRRPNQSLRRTEVILSRIVSCVPDLAAACIVGGLGRMLINPVDTFGADNAITRLFCTTLAAPVVPKLRRNGILISFGRKMLFTAIKIDDVIDPLAKDKTPVEVIAQYLRAAYNSTLLNGETRVPCSLPGDSLRTT